MKQQFMHMKSPQGKRHSAQTPPFKGSSPAEAQPGDNAQSPEAYAPDAARPGPSPNWQTSNSLQLENRPGFSSPPVADQETTVQEAIQDPVTGPIHDGNPVQSSYYSPASGQLSSQPQFNAGMPSFAPPMGNAAPPMQQVIPPFAAPMQPGQGAPFAAPMQQGPLAQGAASPFAAPGVASGALLGPGAPPLSQPLAENNWQQMPPPPNNMGYPGTPPPTQPPRPRAPEKKRFPTWARVVIIILLVLVISGSGAFAYYQLNFAPTLNNITGHQAIYTKGGSNINQSTGDILSGQRVNILLLGSDTDGKGNGIENGRPLAQTDIIVSIDPQTKAVAMVSIPRDLQVTVDGIGNMKLDEVFMTGWSGPDVPTRIARAAGLTMQTIEANYGIHIDHYAWVGLTGFIKVIDTAGGVDIDAIHPMVDDNYPDDINTHDPYGNKRLYIAPGPQHMNGIQALEYVRTRHSDLVGDFGRSQRQQQMLAQLKAKLATPDTISKASDLLKDLNGSVQTDLQLTDIMKMANFATSLDMNKMLRVTLGPPFASPSATNSNYLPNCSLIIPAITKIFDLGNQAKCVPQTNNVVTPPNNQGNQDQGTPDMQATPTPGLHHGQNTHNNQGNQNDQNNSGTQGTPGTKGTPNAGNQNGNGDPGTQSTPTPGKTPNKHHKAGNAMIATPGTTAYAALSNLSQILQASALSLQSGGSDWPGVHSLLDLMFMVVFESFDALTT
ncbi:hypothetical protein EPA93_29855 [Ktedonosporobacter rubrisoli]|uniref:Cell envelope-related transcriptional attenuator domain-containing protein n=1 Tax=Ktedonosporobacter rubrisoli TaxID=2509675 RepID=A0A4P6JX31_KTERU|nr:LCP family protein [Ktedonosporobacter rubrisoli]QBD79962.1 hypothetical protein EPA93_29855 [Ktedonosporobacter rubrisoli]